MAHLSDAVFSICCIAFGIALAEELLPAEGFRRQIRILTVLLLTAAVAKSVAGINFTGFQSYPASPAPESAEIEERAVRMQETALSETVLNGLNRALQEKSVPCRVTEVHLHITDGGSILIDRVTVSGNVLTGTVYLREWLGSGTEIKEEEGHDD